jgi:hypothetical protein
MLRETSSWKRPATSATAARIVAASMLSSSTASAMPTAITSRSWSRVSRSIPSLSKVPPT